MKHLYWRGDSLWCRFALPGKPKRYSLGIKTTGTATDRRRCERLGEETLAALRTHAREDRLFDKKEEVVAPKVYNPKFWRLVGRYWYYHLRFKRSGGNERYHLMHSLKAFGGKYAKDISREDVELWRQKDVAGGAAVNTVNLRFSYLQAAYSWANKESKTFLRLGYDRASALRN